MGSPLSRLIWLAPLLLAGCGGGDGPAASMAIENVTLIDGTDAGAVPGMTVAIEGERIVAVGKTGKVSLGPVANRIDGRGMFLIPGLWDMHVHLHGYRERAFPLFLANGVTTIRDVGGDLAKTGYYRQEVRFGRMLGPDLLVTGPTLDAPEVTRLFPDGRMAVPTAERARAVVDSFAALGVDAFKVHSRTPRAAYFAILDQARRHRIPVVGHVPDEVRIQEAIDSGQRTIEHTFGIAYANSGRGDALVAGLTAAQAKYLASAGPRYRLGPSVDLRLAWNDSATASYDHGRAARFAREMAGRPIWFDPTLVVISAIYRREAAGLANPPELKFVPKEAREFDEGAGRPSPERWQATLLTLGELIRAKAKFVAGTDTPVMPLVPGFSLHRELEILVELGFSPLEALQAATKNAAEAMNRPDQGTIAVGHRADLVLLGANPLTAIGNVRRVQTVIARGRLLDRVTLDRLLDGAAAVGAQR